MKSKFVKKHKGTGFNRDITYLEYEYRGMTYTVCESNTKGNEPLSWQHKAEQNRIDAIIDNPQQKGETVDMNDIYELMGWN